MENTNSLLAQIEQRGLWEYFHKDWLLEIRSQLREQLPDTYHVFVESETILVTPEGEEAPTRSKPDVAVARKEFSEVSVPPQALKNTSAAVIELDELCEEFTQYSLLIRRSPDNHVVAALEILSPSNKGLSSRFDRDKYLQKRDDYRGAGVSFMEIDALLNGERILPDSLRRLGDFQRHAWTAVYHGARRRVRGYGWNSTDPLPIVPWYVEWDRPAALDLEVAAKAAFQFNRWESLVAR
jgi:hypothetical protein